MQAIFSSEIAVAQETLWQFHARLDVLPRISPPGVRVRLPDPAPPLGAGVCFTLVVFAPPLFVPIPWETRFTVYEPPLRFVDEQGRGPFARWRHEHRFESLGENRTLLIDIVDYVPPLGALGRIADRLFVRRQIDSLFAHRHAATRALLESEHYVGL